MSNNNLGKLVAHQYYFKGGRLYRRTIWDREFLDPEEVEKFIQSKKVLAERQSMAAVKKSILGDIDLYIRIKRQFIEYLKKISSGELKVEETYAAE